MTPIKDPEDIDWAYFWGKKLEAKITRIAINDLDKPKGLKNKNAKLQR